MKTKWFIIPVIALSLGCTRENDTSITYIDGEFTLYASSGEKDTKTVIQQDGSIFWSPGDCITVFYGNIPGKFTSTNTKPAASAEFIGSLGSFVLDGETEFKVIYPYSDNIVMPSDEGILSIYLTPEQTAVEGTFADDLFICVAKSKDVNLHFYNVCGGVKFSLARGDIKKVVFRGNNKETLAGTMFVDFNADGIPQVIDFTAGKSSVTLTAPDGGMFKAGSWYYLVLAPQALTNGYTMELWTDELMETISSDASVTIRRSAWGVLKDLAQNVPVESVALDQSELDLSVGRTTTLVATVLPDNASNKNISWVSNNESVATVSSSGVVRGISVGTAVITVSTEDGEKKATCDVTVKEFSPTLPVPEAIHLGLSVLWSSFSLGSSEERYYGNSYSWGETEPKDEYSWSTYKLSSGDGYSLSKYCYSPSYGYNGYSDNKTVLDPEDDAAFMNLGEGWRMPTYEELNELRRRCSWVWVNIGQRMVNRVTGPNGNTIVIPTKGAMNYNGGIWSSTLSSNSPNTAIILSLSESLLCMSSADRCDGLIVRPVYGGIAAVLDKSEILLNVGESETLTVTVLPDDTTNKSVTWASSNESVATVSSSGVVKGISKGNAVISVTPQEGGLSSSCNITVQEVFPIPEAIDLGLPSGRRWASFNVGASKPEEYGFVYAWGETLPKDEEYTWENYKWGNGYQNLTKYNPYYNCGYNGYWDNKTILDPEDDAAFANLGDDWRMPTNDELDELAHNCDSYWDDIGDVRGFVFVGPNGNTLFLPAPNGSYSRYWTSSLRDTYPYCAYNLSINLYTDTRWSLSNSSRYLEGYIRPVYDDQ